MALYHFHVDQIKRSAGQSAIASAAYRAGERLYSEYYGETNDYSRKGGVLHTEILLPPHAPTEYKDRQTLWNAVEKVEKNKKAQLAYNFDIALQNELSMEENISLALRFVQEHFVDCWANDICYDRCANCNDNHQQPSNYKPSEILPYTFFKQPFEGF